jgi:hypothetical protein
VIQRLSPGDLVGISLTDACDWFDQCGQCAARVACSAVFSSRFKCVGS